MTDKPLSDTVRWRMEPDEARYQTATWERRFDYNNPVPSGAVLRKAADWIEKMEKKHGQVHFEVHSVQGDDSYMTVFYRIHKPKKEKA